MYKNYIALGENTNILPGNDDFSNIGSMPNVTKKWLLSMTLLFCMLFTGYETNAQNVVVTGAVTGNGTYATLTAAFTAIGTSQSAANIAISIVGDTNEGTGTVTLGAGTWATVTITPSGARTITGATTAGNPMIDFNGADNVTINGLNSGGNALVISNTTASATTGTATMRFVGGATNNTITNCTVSGSAAMAVGTNGGVIYFATDAVTANGNDNNTVSNCNIGPAGANLPSKGIYGNGSTTNTAIANSGITITNNNIADVFGLAVQSAGIYLGSGNTNWTITNNRLYQTATRTWTTGAIHRGIEIQNTSGQGFTITGNIIGYASNTQTGTYTLAGGTTAGKFQGIFFSGLTGGTSSAISNNTIASVNFSGATANGTGTSSPFAAIIINSGVVTSSSNSFGSQSATGSLTYSTTTTSSTDVYGIYNFGSDSWTASSNNIGGISVTNLGASGTFLLYGLRANTGSAVTFTAASNLIGGTVANSIQLTSTATGSQLVGMFTSNAGATFTSNTIRNLVSNNGTGTTSGASVLGISLTSTSLNNTVSQNTIYALSNSNTSAATVVTGLQFTGGSANVVDRNFIYGLTSATNSTAAEISGIRVTGGITAYRNNMIAIGAGQTNAIGTGATGGVNGIIASGGTDTFFNNTVYIGGNPTAGVGPSFAFNNTTITNTRSFRDNIFVNARNNSGSTGKNYSVQVGGTTANPTGLTINNNIYLATGSGAVFGRFNALDVANIGAWRTAVGQDVASFNTDPQLLDPTNATPDLHINPSIATAAEGNGFDAGVTNDYDGQTRSGLTPVDIGADAGNFTGLDLTPPAISYTPLGSGVVGGNQTLTATITDVSGVPTAGVGLPTLYYKINAGAYTAVTGVSIGSNQYTFTFGSATTLSGDVVSYYIVAQDLAATPNVTALPLAGSGGFTINPPAAGTPPTTPNTFAALGTISGTKTVCASGCTYTSLTSAGGAFAAINNATVTGNVIIEVAGDSTSETGANALNVFASPFTVNIHPTGSARVVSGALASAALVKLNGADRVTIDGSIGGTGTDRSLTITNTSTTSPTAVALISLGIGAGANTDVVKNANISTGASAATGYGIAVGGLTPGTNGADNDDVTLQNNNITVATISIYAIGTAAVSAGGDDNLVISGNTINSNAALQNYGIEVGNALTSSITQNTISVTSSGTVQPTAISLETGYVSSSVTRNTITNVLATATGGYGGRGITVGTGTASSALTIANNIIYGVNGTNWSSFANSSSMGICIGTIGGSTTVSTTAGGINLYYNSISMTGSMGTTANGSATAVTTALYVGSGASALDIRNNIFSNTQTATAVGQKNYAIYSAVASTAYTNINYNDYYVSNSFNAASAIPGFLTSDRTNLAAIVTGFGGNGNSTTGNPQFLSDTNLHINPAATTVVESAGTAIGITTDYDGDTRSATPDIGADEGAFLAPLANDIAATAFIDPATAGNKAVGVAFTPQASFSNAGTATQTSVPVRYRIVGPSPAVTEVYNQTGTIASITSSATSTVSFPSATIAATGTYTIYAKAELVGDAVGANDEISGTLNIVDPYTSATTTQNSNNVAVNVINQQVIGLQVVTSAATGIINSISFNTNGTTNAATDITNAKIFWTGTSSTFAATGQFGSTVASPNGAHVVNGSQALSSGTNYFWLTYDVPLGATPGNAIDAEVTSITVNGLIRTPSLTAPAGFRNIVGPMSGTYLVGAGKSFPNFTNLTTALADLNARGVSAAVTLSLDTDYVSTSETFPLTTGVVTGVNATNTITIKPAAAATPTISGSNATAILNLAGAKYVTVDGSNAVAGTSKDLTISNTNTSGATVSLNTDATNNTIKNAVLKGVTTATSNGVVFIGTAGATTGNDNNTIQNNDISGGATAAVYCFFNSGSTTTTALKNSGNVLSGNNIFNFSTTGIRDDGGSVGTVYASNQIYEVATQTGSIVGFRPSATSIDGFTFDSNRIYDLKTTSTGTLYGIHLFDTSTAGIGVVTNNMIALNATTALTVYGIYDQTATGEVYNLYHNTISLTGAVTGASNSSAYNWSIASTTNFRNNILSNTRTGGTGKHYVIRTNTTLANLTSNYNDLYAGGGTANVFANDGTADRANLAAWQAAVTGKDANSIAYAPVFASAIDLHLTSADTGLDNLGTFIATVTTDYDAQTRSITTPDMGADEFSACTAPTALGYTSNTISYCANNAITTNTPTFTGSAATSYTIDPALPTGLTLNGSTGEITGTPTVASAAANYTVTVNNACGSTTVAVNITVNTSVTYYADTDNDGVGAGSGTAYCTGQPAGTSATNTDCAPADPSKWRTANFFADADGDGYNNGFPAAPVCYGTTTPAGYVAVNNGTDCNDGVAAINSNASEVLGNSIDDNCDGTADEVTPLSYLISSSCGVVLTNLSNTLFAYPLSNYLNETGPIQGYRFRVTNGATVRILNSATNSFALTSLAGGATYATTYTVEVSVKHGGYYRAYGSACSVTTPAVPNDTNIASPSCGSTLTDISNTIFATQVPSASGYRFRVRLGATLIGFVDTTVSRFSLTNLAGIQFATTYTIDVLLAFGGVYRPDTEYGPACSITTPATPATSRVIQPTCGGSISAYWTTIFAQQVIGAQGYKFVVTNGAQTRQYITPNPRFALANLPGGGAQSTAYTIRVDVLYNASYVQGTVLCTLTTTAGASRNTSSALNIYEVKAYPNPYADTFKLDVNTSSENEVGVRVYDMLGREIESREASVANITNLEIGSRYPSGVYNIVVTQGDNVKTIRVIKR